jgi:hypothetical protein
MSTVITPEEFLKEYMQELRKEHETEWNDATRRTDFTKAAAETVIENHGLIPSREYFRVDVIGHEKVGDMDCNWMLRVAFEHENPGSYSPKKDALAHGAPKRRPYWIQEFCKLTHLFADLRVIASYHDSGKDDEGLMELLKRNVNRMQVLERRMTRVPGGQWLFIFGPNPPAIKGFRAFKLGGGNDATVVELEIPS